MKRADRKCRLCEGRGWLTKKDGGGGTAVPCECRYTPEELAMQQTIDGLEALAEQLEAAGEDQANLFGRD